MINGQAYTTASTYEGFDRLVTMTYPDGAAELLSYTYAVNSETIAYGYDDLDRLLSASAPVSESYQ